VEVSPLHSSPTFTRDPNSIYSQLVYATKSTDVSAVMVNGQWLMRDRKLLTLDEKELILAARDYARQIDSFLIQREESVLQKLVAIGGAVEQESFEVQAKVSLASDAAALAALQSQALRIIRSVHYHEYDTYFLFDDPEQGRLRFREDEFIGPAGQVVNVRSRLTLTGARHERRLGSALLSRSRFLAPAVHTLRFYREYFKPTQEREIEKDRRRWLVAYRGEEFFVNLDRMLKPALPGLYLEIKSRTWSRRDAENKDKLIGELLRLFGASPDDVVAEEYVDLAAPHSGR
jgi:5-methylthioadenosine/S-adenosylhomocysteine deaminase